MSLALESVCDTLKLRLTDDSNTRLMASKIIELAQRGVQDAPTLSAMALKEFKHYQAPLARPPHLSGVLIQPVQTLKIITAATTRTPTTKLTPRKGDDGPAIVDLLFLLAMR